MLGRLISEVGSGKSRYYTYDTVGNRLKVIIDSTTTVSYNYDSAGRLISETSNNGSTSTTTTYAYDKNGNLISKTEGTKKTTYTFDVWGNMTSGAGATYTYNAQGLRISKTVNGKKTSFTLVGGAVWSDNTAKYVWGAELITNGSVYYVYNAHGDVIQLLNASGTVTKTYDYDAYGNELSRDLNDANPFRYCGEYYDTETGFIYLRARYYSPDIGRFISVDPAKDGLNWYIYCEDNPANYVDVTGCNPVYTFLNYLERLHDVMVPFIARLSPAFRQDVMRKAILQRDENRATALVNNDGTNYIFDQNRAAGTKNHYKYGGKETAETACEVIAVYNALCYFGRGEPLEDVMYTFQVNYTMVFNGHLGSNPYSIDRVLDAYGIKYTSVTPYQMTEIGMYIFSYWVGQLLDGLHTIALEFDGKKYLAYNIDGYIEKPYEFEPSQYVGSKFVCAYYLGGKHNQKSNAFSYWNLTQYCVTR